MTIPTDELIFSNNDSADNQPDRRGDDEEEEIFVAATPLGPYGTTSAADDDEEIIVIDTPPKPDEKDLDNAGSLPHVTAVPVYNDVLPGSSKEEPVYNDVIPETGAAKKTKKKKSMNPYKRYRSVRRVTKGLGKVAVATGYVVYYGGEILFYTALIVLEVAGNCS